MCHGRADHPYGQIEVPRQFFSARSHPSSMQNLVLRHLRGDTEFVHSLPSGIWQILNSPWNDRNSPDVIRDCVLYVDYKLAVEMVAAYAPIAAQLYFHHQERPYLIRFCIFDVMSAVARVEDGPFKYLAHATPANIAKLHSVLQGLAESVDAHNNRLAASDGDTDELIDRSYKRKLEQLAGVEVPEV